MPRRTWNIKAPLKQKHFIYEAGVIVTHKARWRKSGAQLTQKQFLCRFPHVAQNFAAAFSGKSIFRERQSCRCWCYKRREKKHEAITMRKTFTFRCMRQMLQRWQINSLSLSLESNCFSKFSGWRREERREKSIGMRTWNDNFFLPSQ